VTDLLELAGRAVARPVAALTRVRRAKPMHPRGTVFDGVLSRGRGVTGVPWLDERREDRVLVRVSRAAGLPTPFPDVVGLAVRIPGPEPVDLLLSSTGLGRWSRYVLAPRWHVAGGYGSIMAYRTPAGPVTLAAWSSDRVPAGEQTLPSAGGGVTFMLAASVGHEPWRPFGRVVLGLPRPWDPERSVERGTSEAGLRPWDTDPPLHFDAVRHAPPGLGADGPIARFRSPAYAAARVEQARLADRELR
jgi:hypothetical protein